MCLHRQWCWARKSNNRAIRAEVIVTNRAEYTVESIFVYVGRVVPLLVDIYGVPCDHPSELSKANKTRCIVSPASGTHTIVCQNTQIIQSGPWAAVSHCSSMSSCLSCMCVCRGETAATLNSLFLLRDMAGGNPGQYPKGDRPPAMHDLFFSYHILRNRFFLWAKISTESQVTWLRFGKVQNRSDLKSD